MEALLPEVAERLGISRAKVYELMADGALALGSGRWVPAGARRGSRHLDHE